MMDNSLYYLALNRQVGLASEMDMVANNIANIDTSGYRRQGLVFTEFVVAEEAGESVSMADPGAAYASDLQGEMVMTGGQFDLAIEGDGYFLLQDQNGMMMSRAGSFLVSQDGLLVTPDGSQVLDTGETPITIPVEARTVEIATDGTVSVEGQPLAQIAVVDADPTTIARVGQTSYRPEEGFAPVEFPKVRQGALEKSNVNPVMEIARMIEVSRAYEMAQSVIEDEDDRIQNVISTLGRAV